MIKWLRGRPADEHILQMAEQKAGVTLPADYRKIILSNSSGAPDQQIFTADGEKRIFSRLLSAEKDRHPNIIDALDWIESSNQRLVPFATDPFGNLLCFSYVTDHLCTVVFYEMESGTVTPVKPSFTSLMDLLRAR